MPTPCRKRCQLDAAGLTCLDCGRTLDEIAAWGGLDAAQQARIMAALPERLAAARRLTARLAQSAQQQQQ